MSNKSLRILAIVVVLIAVPTIWWLASPLFQDDVVDEAFPFELPTSAEMETMPEAEKEAKVDEILTAVSNNDLSPEQMQQAEEAVMELAADMPDKEMTDPMPEDEWVIVGQGEFRDADRVHQGSGLATVYQQGDQRVLRFEEFSVTNGPDLHVLLVSNADATSQADMGDYIDLGSLKGNMGNQNYEIPADVDLSNYTGVMIYCMPFHVVFSTAPLQ